MKRNNTRRPIQNTTNTQFHSPHHYKLDKSVLMTQHQWSPPQPTEPYHPNNMPRHKSISNEASQTPMRRTGAFFSSQRSALEAKSGLMDCFYSANDLHQLSTQKLRQHHVQQYDKVQTMKVQNIELITNPSMVKTPVRNRVTNSDYAVSQPTQRHGQMLSASKQASKTQLEFYYNKNEQNKNNQLNLEQNQMIINNNGVMASGGKEPGMGHAPAEVQSAKQSKSTNQKFIQGQRADINMRIVSANNSNPGNNFSNIQSKMQLDLPQKSVAGVQGNKSPEGVPNFIGQTAHRGNGYVMQQQYINRIQQDREFNLQGPRQGGSDVKQQQQQQQVLMQIRGGANGLHLPLIQTPKSQKKQFAEQVFQLPQKAPQFVKNGDQMIAMNVIAGPAVAMVVPATIQTQQIQSAEKGNSSNVYANQQIYQQKLYNNQKGQQQQQKSQQKRLDNYQQQIRHIQMRDKKNVSRTTQQQKKSPNPNDQPRMITGGINQQSFGYKITNGVSSIDLQQGQKNRMPSNSINIVNRKDGMQHVEQLQTDSYDERQRNAANVINGLTYQYQVRRNGQESALQGNAGKRSLRSLYKDGTPNSGTKKVVRGEMGNTAGSYDVKNNGARLYTRDAPERFAMQDGFLKNQNRTNGAPNSSEQMNGFGSGLASTSGSYTINQAQLRMNQNLGSNNFRLESADNQRFRNETAQQQPLSEPAHVRIHQKTNRDVSNSTNGIIIQNKRQSIEHNNMLDLQNPQSLMNQDLQIDTIDSMVKKRANNRNPDDKLQYPEFHNSVGSIIATHGKTTGEQMHQEMIIYDSNADNGDYMDSAQADQPLLLADQFYDDDEPEDDDQSSNQVDNDDFSDSASDNNEQTQTVHDDGNPPDLDGESGESDDLNDQVNQETQNNQQENNEVKQIKSNTTNAQKNLQAPNKQKLQKQQTQQQPVLQNQPILENADSVSKFQSQITNSDHLRFLSSIGNQQAQQIQDAQKKSRTINSKKKKSRGGKKGASRVRGANCNEDASEDDEITPVTINSRDIDSSQTKLAVEKINVVNDPQYQNILDLQQEYKELLQKQQQGQEVNKKDLFLLRPPINNIILNYGPIPGRPPTIFFSYPPFLKMQRPYKKERIQIISQDTLKPNSCLTFRVSNQTHTYNCVVNALKSAGFHMVTRGNGPCSWNCLWTTLIRPSKLKFMNKYQKLNHFAGAWSMGSKANLWRNVQKQRRKHGKEFELCPPTYIFPEDYKRWVNDREMNNFKDMYILKPTAASCGRGIRVIGKKDTVNKRQGYLVSKYLSKPHLLRGYKYDLRIYIVVTCYEPLKAYIFQDGLVRLATQPYSTAKGSLKKRFVHLTNYSVNKKADTYVKNKNPKNSNIPDQNPESATTQENTTENQSEQEMEFKWSLKQLRDEYTKMGINYAEVFAKIKDVCLKTLMAVEPAITSAMRTTKHKGQCFEIYGFDVLIDQNLKAWLLEVNVAPSLSSSSPFDKYVKSMLLSDTLHLVGFNVFDRRRAEEERKLQLSKKKLAGGKSMPPKMVRRPTNVRDESKDEGGLGDTYDSLSPTKIKSSGYSPQKKKDLYVNASSMNSQNTFNQGSPEKLIIKNQYVIPSFLDGFDYLNEDDLDILAQYEEEQHRRMQTKFERIFPTKETIETLGPHFECQRHANSLIWQYIRQKCPIQHLKNYYKGNPVL